MKFCILVAAVIATLLIVPLNCAASTTVNMSELHISLELPTGWVYERNASSGGITYDLEIKGPVRDGYQPYGLLTHRSWPGTVSGSTLWAELEDELDDMERDPEVTSLSVASPAVNMTINGVKACDMTMELVMSGIELKERFVVLASDKWDMGWKFGVACVKSQWSNNSADMDMIVNSLTVAERSGDEATSTIVAIGLVIVLVVVVIVVLMARRRRARPEESMQVAPTPMQPPSQPPTIPPPGS